MIFVCEFGAVLFHEEPLANADGIYLHGFCVSQDRIGSGDGFGVTSMQEGLCLALDGDGTLCVPNAYKDHWYQDESLGLHQGLGEHTGNGRGRGY